MQANNTMQMPIARFVFPERQQLTKVIKLQYYYNVHLPKYRELKLYIKYMVSLRCKMVVKAELQRMGIAYDVIDLGTVELSEDISAEQRTQFRDALLRYGLDLMDDKKAVLIEKVKSVIIEMIHYADDLPDMNYSEYISKKMHLEYNYLANIFSEVKGITIQQFIILHKIEKAKELLLYEDLSLTDIAYKLHYSSVAHLSNQFKKITGLSPSYFKLLKQKRNDAQENL
jgi:AraC-like DNA-binding protein